MLRTNNMTGWQKIQCSVILSLVSCDVSGLRFSLDDVSADLQRRPYGENKRAAGFHRVS